MKITSIETDINDDLEAKQTKETLELKQQVEQAVAPKPMKAPAVPDALSRTPGIPINTQSEIARPDHTLGFSWVGKLTIAAVLIWLILVAGLLLAVLKIGANWQQISIIQWATISGLIIGPALLIFVAGYALRQLAKISTQADAIARAANALTSPDDAVIGKSQTMAGAISAQVDALNEKLNAAVGRLSSMGDVIENQTQALNAANQDARQTVDKINASVETQNTTLQAMTTALDESMVSLANNLTMHTDNLAKSVKIAEQKIKEARISVEGATAKINAASDIVRSNTVQASATLSASHEDIKSLGDIIRLRSEELDEVYKKHAGELTAMIEHLRDEQTALGASMEERLVKMRDLSLSAQASAESLSKASHSGKETIEALAAAASLADGAVKTRFDEMRDMVQYSTEHARSISDMAAQRVQDSLELTRKEITRIEQEMADLQNRIHTKELKSLELVPDEAGDEPQSDENLISQKPSSGRRKRTRLKLKPIIDTGAQPVSEADSEPDSETVSEPEKPVNNTSREQAPLDLSKNLIEPDTIRQSIEPLTAEQPTDADDTKVLDTPKTAQKPKLADSVPPPIHMPDPVQKPVQNAVPAQDKNRGRQTGVPRALDEAIRRAAPVEDAKKIKPQKKKAAKTKARSGLFGGLFGGRNESEKPSALDIVSGAPEPLNPSPPPTDDEILLADLAQLGLSANAVVDQGCIIEATNARVVTGHEAMSLIVAQHLQHPVEHLVKSLAVDDSLSDKAIIFATRFDRTIELLAGNREAIRTRLETEQGRAYLLCDAALNYGRV